MAEKITIPTLMEISKKENYIYLAKNLWTNERILCERDNNLPGYVLSLSLIDSQKLYRVETYKGKIYPVECIEDQRHYPIFLESVINFLGNKKKEVYSEASVKEIKEGMVGLETKDVIARLGGLVWINKDYYDYVTSAGKSKTKFYIKGLELPVLFESTEHLLEGVIASPKI